MKDNSTKLVMILEKSSHNLEISKDGEDVILEGVFAQFGVVNNNDRIYEESEYLPHLEYLNKKIDSKRLLGELDHPEKFDISLSKVSHVIERLEYDKGKRQLTGRVKLLDTPSGRIAKDLVKAGVPISISSRAAGLVENNKKVKIKKIFTYDLVADPGFENAVLNRINESLGIYSELISVYDMGETNDGFLAEDDSTTTETTNTNTEKTTNENMEFVTSEELNAYSLIVKEEIEKIHDKLATVNESKESSDISEKVEELTKSVDKMQKYLDYLANTSDKTIQYTEYVAERLDQVIGYTNYVAKTLDESIAYTEHVAEKADKNIQYSEYLKEQMEKGIAYSEYLKECLEKSVDYSEYVAEKADQAISYAEHIAEKADQSIAYGEYLGEKLAETISYSDYLAESLNKGIAYTEYVAEQTQAVADYTEFAVNEKATQVVATPANTVNEETTIDYNSLPGKVDQLLETIKKQKIEKVDESLQFGFVKLLNEAKAAEFNLLDETKKQKVASALNNTVARTEEEVLNIWESALHPRSEKWIEEAPEQFKQIWGSLDESQKRTLVAQSRTYKLENTYQIKNFWETRPANLLSPKAEKLNENAGTPTTPQLGYSDEYVKAMEGLLGKFNRK